MPLPKSQWRERKSPFTSQVIVETTFSSTQQCLMCWAMRCGVIEVHWTIDLNMINFSFKNQFDMFYLFIVRFPYTICSFSLWTNTFPFSFLWCKTHGQIKCFIIIFIFQSWLITYNIYCILSFVLDIFHAQKHTLLSVAPVNICIFHCSIFALLSSFGEWRNYRVYIHISYLHNLDPETHHIWYSFWFWLTAALSIYTMERKEQRKTNLPKSLRARLLIHAVEQFQVNILLDALKCMPLCTCDAVKPHWPKWHII